MVRDGLEFNTFLVALFAFVYPIFTYMIFNLKHSSKMDSISRYSVIFYSLTYIGGIAVILIFYVVKKGFVEFSSAKNKLSYLFVGYKENKASNLYEIINEILNILTAVTLSGLSSNYDG